MAERGKFQSIVETKLLLDTWIQDHIQKQLRAAMWNDAVFRKITEVLAQWGVYMYRMIQQCRAKNEASLIQCSPPSGTSVSLSQTSPNYTNIQPVVTHTLLPY